MNLWVIFLTGLTIGGLTCLALQGGLLASVIASQKGDSTEKSSLGPTFAFLVSKLIAYTILGLLLGLIGQSLALSDSTQAILQILAGFYMIAVAANLLNLHPIFRYVIIQPPRNLFRFIRSESKSGDFFAPALLGFLTILIPCGTTLAMEALAISTGNPVLGALVMAVFTLGTAPYFVGIGVLASKFTVAQNSHSRLMKVAAIAIFYLALSNINGSLVILNSPITAQSLANLIPIEISIGENEQQNIQVAQNIDGVQVVDLKVSSSGYSPEYFKVKSGEKVHLNLNSFDAYSCALAFRIPALNISKNLKPNGQDFVEFTPIDKGKMAFSCSMGMYNGVMEVI